MKDQGTADARREDPAALVELSSRLVYSALKAAVRLAARFNMPMGRVLDLAELAYYEELRRPTGGTRSGKLTLEQVGQKLGVSLRTVKSLNQRFKSAFFRPETQVEPLRRVTDLLLEGDMSVADIATKLGIDIRDAERAVEFLRENGWAKKLEHGYSTDAGLHSFVAPDLDRRIDAVNNQLEVLAESLWSRFVEKRDESAAARTWVFAARKNDLSAFIKKSIHDLRHGAIDVEEAALSDTDREVYGVTVAFAPMKEDES